MALSCGIVGLPNVGKSTLFNCLTSAGAQSANYPFCTIEPNVGVVDVPDKRLEALAAIVKPKRILPAVMSFVDIAGLVKGASQGEGLGNQFLSYIRDVDAICHLIRCFEDENITHVDGKIDPAQDVQTIDTELILADYDTVSKKFGRNNKLARSLNKEAKKLAPFCKSLLEHLDAGNPARTFEFDKKSNELKNCFRDMHLLTVKPTLFIANVDEDTLAGQPNVHLEAIEKLANDRGDKVVTICAQIESDLSGLNPKDRVEFLNDLGLENSGLERVIKASFELLNLMTYFTAGVKEVRAWTLRQGSKASQAAGVIHTDFERGFIKADVIWWKDFIKYLGEAGCRQMGTIKLEGKDYVVKDGDVMHFKFNV